MAYIYFDVWFPITMVFVIIVIILSIWAARARRIRMQRAAIATVTVAPVVVTSATHTAPGGYVTQMPLPNNYQTNVYSPPYPTQAGVNVQMPMPQMPVAQPPPPGMSGYPPMPMPPQQQQQQQMNPPSYEAAVAGNTVGQPTLLPYEKQSPYNPSFTAH